MRSYLKKMLALIATAVTVSFVSVTNSQAQSEDYLRQIAENTTNILQRVDALPNAILLFITSTLSWISPDTTEATAGLQGGFTQLGNLLVQDMTAQSTMQQQLNTDLLGPDINRSNLLYANDLTYSTVLGAPFFDPDPRNQGGSTTVNPVYNYIKNAAGIKIPHVMPGPNWQGATVDQDRYRGYYNSVMAIQSFGGYVLSNQYADGNQFNTLQQTLLTQISNPDTWLSQVASENIGVVLRQLLLFQSQCFVLLTQLVQTQKQMVSAQVMTNSLLIANNQINEGSLVAKAQGVRQS